MRGGRLCFGPVEVRKMDGSMEKEALHRLFAAWRPPELV
jgi:hypothetical protein